MRKSKFTEEEKDAVIERYALRAESPSIIIKEVGISKSTFYVWLKEYREKREKSNKPFVHIQRYKMMESKVARLQTIIQILKTAAVTIKSPLKDRLSIAEKLSSKYSVHMICEALDIPRGTYYNHILRNKRGNTWYSRRREEFRVRIQEIYDESHQIFGAEKIRAILKNEGQKISVAMVRELMRDMGLISIRQSAKKLYEDDVKRPKNYLNQEFDVDAPDQVWVSDVTCFKCNHKTYYICVIMDLYARLVIGYTVGYRNSTQLIKTTFKKAYRHRNHGGSLLFHSDRGSNYISKAFNDYVKSCGVTRSFSRPYVPYDNSVMESFFASLKREELYRRKYASEKEFYKAVDQYIIFYNTRRPHAKMKYKTPEQKEREYSRSINDICD